MTPLRLQLNVLLLGIVLFGAWPRVAALEPEDVLFIQIGPLSLRPQLSVAEIYVDNILYQASADQVHDLTTIISPGLKLQLGRPEHNYLSMGYTYDQLLYLENSELNTGQHTFELKNQFELQRLRLIGTDRIQILSNPLGGVVERIIGPDGTATVSRRNVDRIVFDDNYTLSYEVSEKTAPYLRVTHYATDYQEGITLYDIQNVTGTVGFGYRAFPKTILFGEVYYGRTTTGVNHPLTPGNPDLNSIGGYLGLRGNFTAKVSGSVKVGYESREFADGTSAPSEPVVDLAVAHRISEKQNLTLSYARQNSVSIQYSRLTYTADSVGVQFSQMLGSSRKWQGKLGVSYAMYSYENTQGTRLSSDYNYLRASGSLAYQVQRWLTAQLGYDFEHVSGDQRAVIDYYVNRVTLRLAIGY